MKKMARWSTSKPLTRRPTLILAILLVLIFFLTYNRQGPGLFSISQEWMGPAEPAGPAGPAEQEATVAPVEEESVVLPVEEESIVPPEPVSMPQLSQSEVDMFASHAINNTVIIVPVNNGMLQFAFNLVCSLESISFDISALVFWALDEDAEKALQEKGHTTYRDPSLFYVSNDANEHGNTGEYARMMRERPKFFIKFLQAGFDMLMMDVDIVFYQTPLLLMPSVSDMKHVDAVYSTDARDFYTDVDAFDDPFRRGALMPPICNGLFWMRSNEHTIRLWTDMEKVFADESHRSERFQWKGFSDDQRGMDVLLNDGRANLVKPYPSGIVEEEIPKGYAVPTINVTLLDQTQVVNGHLFVEKRERYEQRLVEIREQGFDRVATHMNWNTADLTKEQGAKDRGLYLLDEAGNCKI